MVKMGEFKLNTELSITLIDARPVMRDKKDDIYVVCLKRSVNGTRKQTKGKIQTN
jgi:hypothetical protein